LNLAVWFGLHTIFAQVDELHAYGLTLNIPVLNSISWPTLVLSLAAMIAMFRFKVGMIPALAASCALGVAWYLVVGTV